MDNLRTTDNNCGKSLLECNVDLARLGNIYKDLTYIANVPLKDLAKQNKDLLIFPKTFSPEEGIDEDPVFNLRGPLEHADQILLETHNMMGFIGVGNTQIKINSRFETGEEDFFLYYLLQKVYSLNLFNLKFSSGMGYFDFLLFLFPQFLNKALAQGLFKTYRTFSKNDANIKGVVNISNHIRVNTPFRGNIAYTSREFSTDNDLTQLIRHAIEYIKLKQYGKSVLFSNEQTRQNINTIIFSTPTYNKKQRDLIIKQNIKPFQHPYFTEYRFLQKLCLAILQNKKLQYGDNSNRIYGILFDGAWLWEEYLGIKLKNLGFKHAQNKIRTNGINLWVGNPRYPDFYKGAQENSPIVDEGRFVLDAKYKKLKISGENSQHKRATISREDAHQIVTYMHILPAKNGGLIYPYTGDANPNTEAPREVYGLGGNVYTFGVKIPNDALNYKDFCEQMKKNEKEIETRIEDLLNKRE